MKEILSWAPLVWTIRGCAIIILLMATWAICLYLLRFLRPRNIRALAGAAPPAFRQATVEGFGMKVGGELERLDTSKDEQLQFLSQAIERLDAGYRGLHGAVATLLRREAERYANEQRREHAGRG